MPEELKRLALSTDRIYRNAMSSLRREMIDDEELDFDSIISDGFNNFNDDETEH